MEQVKFMEMQKLFNEFSDNVNHRFIDTENVMVVMRMLGQNPSSMELTKAMKNTEKKKLTFDDLVEISSSCWSTSSLEDDLRQAFGVFDKTGTGCLNVAEFKKEMLNRGEKMSEEEFNELIELVGEQNGKISINALIAVLIEHDDRVEIELMDNSLVESIEVMEDKKHENDTDIYVNELMRLLDIPLEDLV